MFGSGWLGHSYCGCTDARSPNASSTTKYTNARRNPRVRSGLVVLWTTDAANQTSESLLSLLTGVLVLQPIQRVRLVYLVIFLQKDLRQKSSLSLTYEAQVVRDRQLKLISKIIKLTLSYCYGTPCCSQSTLFAITIASDCNSHRCHHSVAPPKDKEMLHNFALFPPHLSYRRYEHTHSRRSRYQNGPEDKSMAPRACQ